MASIQQLETVSPYESVADFYAGKSIFITGGTGFLGKALIEKLLYSCKDIDKIFILVRDKKGVSAEKRLQQMTSKPIFSRITSSRPQDLKKIIPIIGDITQPNLGISSADDETLTEKVSVVFHMAATIKFNETLETVVTNNVKGTEHVLNLCHRIKNIKAYVHVSTAYSNAEQKVVEEKLYPPRADLNEVYKYMIQPYQDTKYIEEQFFKGLPNNYTFTKSLAENYVAEHCKNIPTVIIRPSIVSSSLREPHAGWTDNWMGATGLVFASVKGVNRVVLGDGNNILDIIPVDYVTNVTIVAATKCMSSNSVTVYNSCTSSCNPVSIRQFFNGVRNSAIETRSGASSTNVMYTNNKHLMRIMTFLLQTMPAYMADLFLRVTCKEPKYVKLQARTILGRSVLEYFTTQSWEMKSDNVKALHASLSYSDKIIFPCDPSHMDWDQYTAVFLNGVNRYLMEI